jgi:hypothetical protein
MSLDEKLGSALRAIQEAYSLGFSFSSSPIDLLLETGIDLSLILAEAYRVGQTERQTNPEVKFDYGKSDPLGNPLSRKVFKTRRVLEDQAAAKFFKQLARLLVLLKRREPFDKAFMALVGKDLKLEPPIQSERARSPTTKAVSRRKSRNEIAYYRRRNSKDPYRTKVTRRKVGHHDGSKH